MLEIPGYYYDASKKKYFKIEKSHTAPPEASWSADKVKQRRREESSREEARRKADLVRRHVRRHALGRDALCGGLLTRETGSLAGRGGKGDLGCEAWAADVADKGSVSFSSGEGGRRANLSCLWVGHGVAYTTVDEMSLLGTYLSTDENERLTFGNDDFTGEPSRVPRIREEIVRCPQMSSITYHEPSHRMLLTSREMNANCGLCLFSPPVEGAAPGPDGGPMWMLGEATNYEQLAIRDDLVNSCTPAAASSDLICILGTNTGLVSLRANGRTTRTGAPPGSSREIFTQDFQQSNHNVVFAGGRQPRLLMADLRTPSAEWTRVPHASSVTHLRSVNPHQVLVAGLQSEMCLYDTRFFRHRRPGPATGSAPGNGTAPLVSFPGYTNAAHLHAGWDLSPEMDLVAAAHHDGTIRLFSLTTGRLMRCPALEALRADTPIKALTFASLPGERLPSLWVAEGHALRKFSLGPQHFAHEA